jgi:two-component system response regulator ResD
MQKNKIKHLLLEMELYMSDLTILVVDDESRMRKLIKDFLKQKDFNILEAEDGEVALKVYNENKDKINLILLDVMMPKLDGWSVLRQIRQENKSIPIVMLTARTEEQDELFGFELGVDEYIAKPFSPKILVARVEAILKRTTKEEKKLKDYDGIVIDNEGRTVSVDGKTIELSFREYELLKYLLDNENIALSRDKILNTVWNYDYYGDSRTIDSHIKKIRHKLGKKGKHIQTIRGIGYKFEIKK